MAAELIDPHPARWVDAADPDPPRRPAGLVPLAGAQRLFLREYAPRTLIRQGGPQVHGPFSQRVRPAHSHSAGWAAGPWTIFSESTPRALSFGRVGRRSMDHFSESTPRALSFGRVGRRSMDHFSESTPRALS